MPQDRLEELLSNLSWDSEDGGKEVNDARYLELVGDGAAEGDTRSYPEARGAGLSGAMKDGAAEGATRSYPEAPGTGA